MCKSRSKFFRNFKTRENSAAAEKKNDGSRSWSQGTASAGSSSHLQDDYESSYCVFDSVSRAAIQGVNQALVYSQINGKPYKTLLDTGSSKSFVNKPVAGSFCTKRIPHRFRVGMAQASNSAEVSSVCNIPSINLLGRCYKDVRLYVMENLCVDILLGRDFLEFHQRVVFEFGGLVKELVVPKIDDCGVVAANIEAPSLFANLRPGWKPIATKSRRFNEADREFIRLTVSKWKADGTVRPSHSPWRAQCVVVKHGNRIERLAIDYSQTINLFTEKDGFPIPLIEDIVNQLASYKFFASYDLKKAYHQVPICEKDKSFTAFEADGELLEFNVMPFGVTNGGPIFQRVMTNIIKSDRLVNTFVYFDNVVVGAHSLEDLELQASKFRDSIARRSMTLNDSKTV